MASLLALTACGPVGGGDDRYETPPTLSCAEGMMEYAVEGTPMQFCYDPAWGEVVLSDLEATRGSGRKITFSNAGNSPTVKYRSYDYEGPEDSFCYDCFNINGPQDTIKTAVAEQLAVAEDDISVRKTEVFGYRAVRVNDDETIHFYTPAAFDANHLDISAPSEAAVELDDFVFDFIIY